MARKQNYFLFDIPILFQYLYDNGVYLQEIYFKRICSLISMKIDDWYK